MRVSFNKLVFHSMSVSCTVSEIFYVECWRVIEICVKGHSRSLKMVPFERYWRFTLSVALSCIVFKIKRDVSQKSGFFHIQCELDVLVKGDPIAISPLNSYGRTRMVVLREGEQSLRTYYLFRYNTRT